jgi:hypothetical protein
MAGKRQILQADGVTPIIGQTAGLGTFATVAAAAANQRRKQTLPGIGNAQRTVQEDLDLGLGLLDCRADIDKRQLTRRHHTGSP